MKQTSNFPIPAIIKFVFGFTLCYWTYHVLISQMVVVQDALVYQHNAKIFLNDGWIGYFKAGPTREPLYPFIISWSMRFQEFTHIPYQDIQKVVQLIFALSAQYLLWQILRKLEIHTTITALILFYFAISPDVVNSIVSLFTEVITYPFTLMVVLLCLSVREKLFSKCSSGSLISTSCFLGLCFLMLTLIKGAFEFIFPLLFLSFVPLLFTSWKHRQHSSVKRILCIMAVLILTVSLPLFFIKSMNKKYNGNFVLTDRGAFMLYGNTTRHLEAFSWKRISMGFITVTQSSEKICPKIFSASECAFWDFRNSDAYAVQKCAELEAKGYTVEESNKQLIHLALNKILHNPLGYFPFYFLEALSVTFWKSGEIGFVAYPNWLIYLYGLPYFRFFLSLLTGILTVAALLNLVRLNVKYFKTLMQPAAIEPLPGAIFYTGLIAFGFIALHATIAVLTRYCLPIVPLYLISIAIFLNPLMRSK